MGVFYAGEQEKETLERISKELLLPNIGLLPDFLAAKYSGNLGARERYNEKLLFWLQEREIAIIVLRRLCAEHGDNDWPDELHLADVIEKHLANHLAE